MTFQMKLIDILNLEIDCATKLVFWAELAELSERKNLSWTNMLSKLQAKQP